MVDKLNIYQKLVEVRKVLGKVNKDTKGYGFEYVSGAQILGKIKDTMDSLGILLEPHLLDGSVREVTSTNAKGKSVINYVVTSQMKMHWINADSPEDRSIVDWFMVGEQTDPSQAFGSGLTYAERYFILKYFNAETDADDPDKNKGKGKQEEADPFAGDYNSGDKDDFTDDIGKNERLCTEKQLKRLYAMMKEAGVAVDEWDAMIKKKYKIESKKEMSMKEIDKVFDSLDEIIKKNSQGE